MPSLRDDMRVHINGSIIVQVQVIECEDLHRNSDPEGHMKSYLIEANLFSDDLKVHFFF